MRTKRTASGLVNAGWSTATALAQPALPLRGILGLQPAGARPGARSGHARARQPRQRRAADRGRPVDTRVSHRGRGGSEWMHSSPSASRSSRTNECSQKVIAVTGASRHRGCDSRSSLRAAALRSPASRASKGPEAPEAANSQAASSSVACERDRRGERQRRRLRASQAWPARSTGWSTMRASISTGRSHELPVATTTR